MGWKEDTTEILSHADVVLVPSRYEGYGLVSVEALAAGVPVIATDVGVAREAGAIVISDKKFVQEIVHWIETGPRKASLLNYPYRDFDDYAERYVADIEMCTMSEK